MRPGARRRRSLGQGAGSAWGRERVQSMAGGEQGLGHNAGAAWGTVRGQLGAGRKHSSEPSAGVAWGCVRSCPWCKARARPRAGCRRVLGSRHEHDLRRVCAHPRGQSAGAFQGTAHARTTGRTRQVTCRFCASLKHKYDGQTKFIKPNSQRQDRIIKYWVSIGSIHREQG